MTAEVNNEVPVWLRPLLARTEPASAYLITGDEGAGADVLAFALAAKFSGVADITQHPDIMLVRPHVKKKKKKGAADDGDEMQVATDDDSGDDSAPAESDDDDGDDGKAGKGKKKKTKNRAIFVEDARAITAFCARMPMVLERRVVVVLRGEKMRGDTQNALLKTLEEPGGGKVFILRANNAKQLAPTIVSRCRVIAIPPPAPEEAAEWLNASGGDIADLHYYGGLPLAIKDDRESRELRAAIVGEMNKGAKADIHAAAGLCAKSGEWFDCLQKWAADGARVAAGASPRYFPAAGHLRAPLAKWLDLHAKLIKRKMLLDHPLSADLRIRETLHACRQTLAD